MKIEEYYEPEDQKIIDEISNLIDHYREKYGQKCTITKSKICLLFAG